MNEGALVLSLDFELHWGVRDHTSVDAYRNNLLGVRTAIPAMLELFERRGIAATWATVGFLFAETKQELERSCPSLLPSYRTKALSPYESFGELGSDERSDPFHYAPSLIRRIVETPGQELATHTFSHYYCLEPGQTRAQFDADLEAARKISTKFGAAPKSIVFPRNQANPRYNDVLHARGINTFRCNTNHWAYHAEANETQTRRLYRLMDAYLPLGGPRTAPTPLPTPEGPTDVPASAFLRPYSQRLRHLDALRQRRLTEAMTHAAKTGGIFHLWWHPHNFGAHPKESMAFLEALIVHFQALRRTYGMESMTMLETARAASPAIEGLFSRTVRSRPVDAETLHHRASAGNIPRRADETGRAAPT